MTVWDEVGDGCFRRRYRRFDLNIGVVRGADALLVVDTRADVRQADELLDELRELGSPVRWVVNSHYHFDHVFGNQRFAERAAGVRPAGEAVEVAADLELWGHVELPAALLDDEARMRAELRCRYGDEAGDEYDRVVLTPPDRLVAHRHVLDLGDRGVELVHHGRGHTGNDLVVVAPDARVMFAGDLVEESAPPAYGGDCFPLDWPATVAALAATGVGTYVPGHGDLMSPAAVAAQVGAIATVADLVRELHAAGIPASTPGARPPAAGRSRSTRSSRPSRGATPSSTDAQGRSLCRTVPRSTRVAARASAKLADAIRVQRASARQGWTRLGSSRSRRRRALQEGVDRPRRRDRRWRPASGRGSCQSVIWAGSFPVSETKPAQETNTAQIPHRRAPVASGSPAEPSVTLVALDLAHRLEGRDAGDPAASVGGRSGLVETGDRGAEVGVAGGRAEVEQLVGRQLAVEDVAADQAVLVLHLVRTDHGPVQDRAR